MKIGVGVPAGDRSIDYNGLHAPYKYLQIDSDDATSVSENGQITNASHCSNFFWGGAGGGEADHC